jgi:hypothetical protein
VASISVTDETLRRLEFAAKVAGVTVSDVIERLVNEWSQADAPEPSASVGAERPRLKVHAHYRGARVAGSFDPVSNELLVEEGPGSGKRYPSPSAAATAVTVAVNPERRHPNTNGRNFWTASEERVPLGTWLSRRATRSR